MVEEKRWRTVRCKTSFGIVVSWTLRRTKEEKWVLSGVGNARRGNMPIPCDFLPFEISNAVLGHHKPEFDSFDAAADYVRSI